MINFFRKIRRKLADDNQFLKYSRYAIGEIVLVVVGILIALSINNWHQKGKNRQVEQNYLKRIQTSLINSQSEMDRVINKTRGVYTACSQVIHISKSEEYDLPFMKIDSLVIRLNTGYSIYTPDQGVIHEILNSDNLDLIRNEVIRSHIADWDSRHNKIKNYEEFIKIQIIKYGDFVSNYIDYSNEEVRFNFIVSDKRIELLSSSKLRYYSGLIRGMSNVVLDLYMEEKKILDSLELIVVKELKIEILKDSIDF